MNGKTGKKKKKKQIKKSSIPGRSHDARISFQTDTGL